ncbi:MAG: lytic transglycosylase domain-containing protein [Patescibacteria group bacterium]
MLGKRLKIRLLLALAVLIGLGAGGYYYLPAILGDTVYPLKYQEHIIKYSRECNVDPALVVAVIFQESRFNPRAVSPKGAAGLMQFMPGTAKTMARELGYSSYDIYDAETSVHFGACHIRDLLIKYNGNLDAALAGYNAGTGNADRWIRLGILDNIPFYETNNYVKRVKNYQTVYAAMYAKELDLTPPLQVEKSNETAQIRGYIWAQLFANIFKI